MTPVYRSNAVRDRIFELTQEFRAPYASSARDVYVETSFGRTYAMELGDPSRRTLVVLHGGMTNHAFILYFLRHLIGRYHIICPDLPGHAGFSAETRIDPRGDDFGRWMVEVLDAIGVAEADFVGTSYGGFVVNRTIAVARERVRSAVLIVPGGVVDMSPLRFTFRVLFWQLLHSLTGRERFFDRIVAALFTDMDDRSVREFFRLVLTGTNIDRRPMKLSTPDETSGFDRPVHVIAAERDVIFDPEALRRRLPQLYPHATLEVLRGSMHSPSIEEEALVDLNGRVIAALERD